ncbi:MAG: hypothetical protein ACJASV_001871 [Pseudorhodobacter sp.]|jgi:hypothetical protein
MYFSNELLMTKAPRQKAKDLRRLILEGFETRPDKPAASVSSVRLQGIALPGRKALFPVAR